MIKPLYVDAIAYFEKLEKKHAYQVNKAKWQGRSEQEIENIQRKKEYARLAVEALRQMEGGSINEQSGIAGQTYKKS